MLTTQPIIAFVPTTDFAVAESFYGTTLGLRLVSRDDFALVFEAGGTMLRVVQVGTVAPAPYTILGWRVPRIRTTVTALKKRGISFERFPGMDQDSLGIWSAPGGAQVAWFKDPAGNVLSISSHPSRRRITLPR